MHSHLFQKATRRKRLGKKKSKAVSRTSLSAHFKLDWCDMKKSQKQWKINSFQKSPFGEALLIAFKSAVKSGSLETNPLRRLQQLKKEGV